MPLEAVKLAFEIIALEKLYMPLRVNKVVCGAINSTGEIKMKQIYYEWF